MGARHDWTLSAGQRLAGVRLALHDATGAKALADSIVAIVRDKYGRIPSQFASVVATQGAAFGTVGDSASARRAFREALAALAQGTYVDSAAISDIAARYAPLLPDRAAANAFKRSARTKN